MISSLRQVGGMFHLCFTYPICTLHVSKKDVITTPLKLKILMDTQAKILQD